MVQNMYVYKRPYESGGLLWPTVFGQMMCALYFMQVRRRRVAGGGAGGKGPGGRGA